MTEDDELLAALKVRQALHAFRLANLEAQALRGGEPGPQGAVGPPGPMPDHRWVDTSLQFEKPSGEWGKLVNLKGEKGEPGLVNVIHAGGGSTIVEAAPSTPTLSWAWFPAGFST